MSKPSTAPRPRRRWLWVLSGLLLLPVLAALALPGVLNSRAGRDWLLRRANRALAPGGLRLDSLTFSWFGPTRITRFVLLDARGDRVVDAPRATWDRHL